MIKSLKNNLGVILIWTLVIIPFLIWLFMLPLGGRFGSLEATFRSLGQVSGLLGMTLLSINFILSTRFKFLDRWFNGLNRVYIKHHIIGALAFCFLLFHPLLLAAQFISLQVAFRFIFSLEGWQLNLGKLGLLVLILLMVITLYLNFKYQNWKSTHKYLGLVLFLGGLHMFFISSDISNNVLLKYYMLTLASLATGSYLYRTVFSLYKRGEYKYKLTEVLKINDSIIELKLTPLTQKINFLPGQFIFLRFQDEVGVLSESHPFSIISSTGDAGLALGIKTVGDYTSMLPLMKPGATCRLEGPFGAFSYSKAGSKRQIWIAGGIGITPFVSMARELNTQNDSADDYKIDLYYSIKNVSEAVFAPELLEISKRNKNFKFYEHFSEKDGYISAQNIVKNNEHISDAEIFLCGPLGFMQSLRAQFIKLGFNKNRVHSEEFSLQS